MCVCERLKNQQEISLFTGLDFGFDKYHVENSAVARHLKLAPLNGQLKWDHTDALEYWIHLQLKSGSFTI